MYKKIVCVLVYLSMTLPVASSAEALKRYSVPQQEPVSTVRPDAKVLPSYVSEDVYEEFRVKIQNLSQDKKDELVKHFRAKVKQAKRDRNKGAEAYYQRLIGIIETNS